MSDDGLDQVAAMRERRRAQLETAELEADPVRALQVIVVSLWDDVDRLQRTVGDLADRLEEVRARVDGEA